MAKVLVDVSLLELFLPLLNLLAEHPEGWYWQIEFDEDSQPNTLLFCRSWSPKGDTIGYLERGIQAFEIDGKPLYRFEDDYSGSKLSPEETLLGLVRPPEHVKVK